MKNNDLGEVTLKKKINYVLSETILLFFPFCYLSPLRIMFLKVFGAEVGKDCFIGKIKFSGLHHKGFKNLKIGNNVFLGNYVLLDLTGEIEIQDNVTIAMRSIILTHTNVGKKNHPLRKRVKCYRDKTIIGSGSFIGANSVILAGTQLKENSIVGAVEKYYLK